MRERNDYCCVDVTDIIIINFIFIIISITNGRSI